MTRAIRIFGLLALVALLSALPFAVMAQQSPPHVLIGTATLNGAIPPPGTEIVAIAGDTKLGSAMTTTAGRFVLGVMQPSGAGAIRFKVDGVDANETLADWELGKVSSGFKLTATDSASAHREPPHVLLGTAMLEGEIPPVGTEIVALAGGTILGSTLTRAGGKFTLLVSRPPGGGVVTFTVDGVSASESLGNWEFGKIQPGFNISARNMPVADALEPLINANNLVSVWHFDNRMKAWYFYAPGLEDESTLATIRANEVYLIQVLVGAEVVLNGTTRRLTCVGGNCWTYIPW